MIKIIAVFFLAVAHLVSQGQDKDALAKVYYTNAEEYFNRGTLVSYDSCVTELEKAEKVLETTNPKILFLKIKAMTPSVLSYNDVFYAYDLDESLSKFFEIVDSKNYPADKYKEMVNINEKFTRPSDLKSLQKYRNSDVALVRRGTKYSKTNDQLEFTRACFIQSANRGNTEAMEALAQSYYQKVLDNKQASDLNKNCENAEYWYTKLAKAGEYEAWEKLGEMYYSFVGATDPDMLVNGEDISSNHFYIKRSLQYFTLAAESNIGAAFFWLGNLHSKLVGVYADYKKAMQYYLKACSFPAPYCPEDLRSRAMFQISEIYDEGIAIKRDKSLAKEWKQRALHTGQASVDYNTGITAAQGRMYDLSITNFEEAIREDSTYLDAYLSLAGIYGELRKYERSVTYFEIARTKDSSYFQDFLLPYSINLAGLRKFDEALKAVNHFLLRPRLTEREKDAALYRKRLYETALSKNK